MVSLRKLFLIPAALVVVAGVALAAPALTVINCAAPAPGTGVLRSEGHVELLPTLTFVCTNSAILTAVQAPGQVAPFTISVYTSGAATFTSSAPGTGVTTAPVISLGVVPADIAMAAAVASVAPNAVTFATVGLPVGAAGFTLNIKGLYVDATMIPAGSSIGLTLIAASTNSAIADSAIFGTPASPVLSVPNVAVALKSITVTDTVDPKNPTSLKACATDAFDVTKPAGTTAPYTNGIVFDTVKIMPVLPTSFGLNTRVAISVTNFPSGAQLYAPLHLVSGVTTADLMAGFNATTLTGGYVAGTVAGTTDVYALIPASGLIVYQISAPGLDPLSINLVAVANGPVLAATPVSVMVGYAPVGGTTFPNFAAGTTVSSNFITVDACASSLFFPYVVAGGGYDTGIAISSSGNLGDASKSASGQCVISFMGKGAPMTTKTLDVTVGQTNAFDIVGSMPTANFYGYAVAKCNFLNASGYAYVANSTGGTASYLPLDK